MAAEDASSWEARLIKSGISDFVELFRSEGARFDAAGKTASIVMDNEEDRPTVWSTLSINDNTTMNQLIANVTSLLINLGAEADSNGSLDVPGFLASAFADMPMDRTGNDELGTIEGNPFNQFANAIDAWIIRKRTTLMSSGMPTWEMPELSEKQYLIIEELKRTNSMSADTRRTADDIAECCDGKFFESGSYKPLFADLSKRGLVKSKSGRGGGSWLTDEGVRVANLLILNRKTTATKR